MRLVENDSTVRINPNDSDVYVIDSPTGDSDEWLIRVTDDVEEVEENRRYHYRSGVFDGIVRAQTEGTDHMGDAETFALRPVSNHRDVAHVESEPTLPRETLREFEILARITHPLAKELGTTAEEGDS